MLTMMMLLVGALAAGCDDTTDCPAAVAQGISCTTAGLSCFAGANACTCTGGLSPRWECKAPDMAVHDLAVHDLAPPTTD
jgi:hypothetical protein